MSMPPRRWLFLGILAAGAILRLLYLDAEFLWGDEQFSHDAANAPIATVIHRVSLDAHPPLFYILLHYYQMIFPHPTVWQLRLLPALLGIAGVALVFAFGRRFISEPAALWAMALAAVSSFLIDYAQELRTYTLVIALTLMSSYCLMLGIAAPRGRRRIPFMAYAVIAALCLFSHYHTAFFLLSQGVFVLGWSWRRRDWDALGEWVLGMALTGFIYGIWLPFQIRQFFNAYIHWLPDMTLEMVGLFPLTYVMLWGIHHRFVAASIPIAVGIGLVLAVVWFIGRRPGPAPEKQPEAGAALWLMAATAIVPIALVAAVSAAVQNLFYPRYLIFTAPGFIILAGYALSRMRPRWAAAAFVLVAAINLALVVDEYNVRRKEDWNLPFDYAKHEMGQNCVYIFHADAIYTEFCRHSSWRPARLLIEECLPALEELSKREPKPDMALIFYFPMMLEDEYPLVLLRTLADEWRIEKGLGLPVMLLRGVKLAPYFERQVEARRAMAEQYAAWWLPDHPGFDAGCHQLEADAGHNLFRWTSGNRGHFSLPVALPPGEYEGVWEINTWRPDTAQPLQFHIAANGQPWPAAPVGGRGPLTLRGPVVIKEDQTRVRFDFEQSTWRAYDIVKNSNDERDLGFMLFSIGLKPRTEHELKSD